MLRDTTTLPTIVEIKTAAQLCIKHGVIPKFTSNTCYYIDNDGTIFETSTQTLAQIAHKEKQHNE